MHGTPAHLYFTVSAVESGLRLCTSRRICRNRYIYANRRICGYPCVSAHRGIYAKGWSSLIPTNTNRYGIRVYLAKGGQGYSDGRFYYSLVVIIRMTLERRCVNEYASPLSTIINTVILNITLPLSPYSHLAQNIKPICFSRLFIYVIPNFLSLPFS
jgi:hypothetical protein